MQLLVTIGLLQKTKNEKTFINFTDFNNNVNGYEL